MDDRLNYALTPAQKADARRALRILSGGASLEAAANAFVAGKRSMKRMPLAEVANDFIHSRVIAGCRNSTLEWYNERIEYVVDRFGGTIMDEVTRAQFRDWLSALELKPASKAGVARAARALWRWAMHHEPPLAALDVTTGVKFSVTPNAAGGGSLKYLSVDQCAQLLANLQAADLSAVALMLFAGIRPEEVCGESLKPWLKWSSVNTVDKIIRVPSECAKTGGARVLEGLPETVWRFLDPGKADATISTFQRRTLLEHTKIAGGFGGPKQPPWPQDGLRHTFASYAVAEFEDPGKVALWMGHNGNPTMLHRHYRGLVTKAEAKKFWALRG